MKKTLPVIYGLAKNKELSRIYQKEALDQGDIALVPDILEQVGARDYAQGMAQHYFIKAWNELETAAISPKAKDELKAIAAFVEEREY